MRALLISALYNITSFRRLCQVISENIAFRWFCFLTSDDKVFDHSTISYCIERIGQEGFKAMFPRLNEELWRLGLLSPKLYADSTLVRANVSSQKLSPSDMTVEEFPEKAIVANGLSIVPEDVHGEGEGSTHEVGYYQDPKGQLPLIPVDPDARWRTQSQSRRPQLCYPESAIVDQGGFTYKGEHPVCPQGKVLRRGAYHPRDDSYKYAARQQECQTCPVKGGCLPVGQRCRSLTLSVHYPTFLKARDCNLSPAYKAETRKRQTAVEGVFAHLDRLGWACCRLRSLWKVDGQGSLAAAAHNIMRAVRNLALQTAPSALAPSVAAATYRVP